MRGRRASVRERVGVGERIETSGWPRRPRLPRLRARGVPSGPSWRFRASFSRLRSPVQTVKEPAGLKDTQCTQSFISIAWGGAGVRGAGVCLTKRRIATLSRRVGSGRTGAGRGRRGERGCFPRGHDGKHGAEGPAHPGHALAPRSRAAVHRGRRGVGNTPATTHSRFACSLPARRPRPTRAYRGRAMARGRPRGGLSQRALRGWCDDGRYHTAMVVLAATVARTGRGQGAARAPGRGVVREDDL